jgi:hypothetical protein
MRASCVAGTLGGVCALVLAIPASASTGSTYWTARQAQAALSWPAHTITWLLPAGNDTSVQRGVDGDGARARLQSATCRGLGKPVERRYSRFSCEVQWTTTRDHILVLQGDTVWMRPWSASTICASEDLPADGCPPPPLAHPLQGDPRDCSLGPRATGIRCVLYNARQAVRQQETESLSELGCVATAVFVYWCSWNNGNGNATVRFLQGSTGWTTTVTPG